jgi:phosphate acetyltransferase
MVLPPVTVAVVHPCDDVSLQGAIDAHRPGLIAPILVGQSARIQSVADRLGIDISTLPLVASAHSHDSAAKAVALVRAAKAQALMEGSLHTEAIMAAAVAGDTGIRTERRISHCLVMDVRGHDDPLIITHAAVNIAPTLEDKVDILQNAIDLAHAIGLTTSV